MHRGFWSYLSIVFIEIVFFLFVFPKNVNAGCNFGSVSLGPALPCSYSCHVSNNSANERCVGPAWFQPGYSYDDSWQCNTGPEAQAICGSGAPVCGGSCDSSTCGTNGTYSCHDFDNNIRKCRTVPGCVEDFGKCSGKYCGSNNGVVNCNEMTDQNCVAWGCHYTPTFNSCATTCTNGICQNDCGINTSCPPRPRRRPPPLPTARSTVLPLVRGPAVVKLPT